MELHPNLHRNDIDTSNEATLYFSMKLHSNWQQNFIETPIGKKVKNQPTKKIAKKITIEFWSPYQ